MKMLGQYFTGQGHRKHGAWAPINISSGVTNGCQHTVLNITETIEIL